MAYKNFKIETDADGIALVTWDTPGRSMNVLDETSVTELERDRQADHPPMPRSRASSSPRARRRCAPAPICRCWRA